MSSRLIFFKGAYLVDYVGDYYRDYSGDIWRLVLVHLISMKGHFVTLNPKP